MARVVEGADRRTSANSVRTGAAPWVAYDQVVAPVTVMLAAPVRVCGNIVVWGHTRTVVFLCCRGVWGFAVRPEALRGSSVATYRAAATAVPWAITRPQGPSPFPVGGPRFPSALPSPPWRRPAAGNATNRVDGLGMHPFGHRCPLAVHLPGPRGPHPCPPLLQRRRIAPLRRDADRGRRLVLRLVPRRHVDHHATRLQRLDIVAIAVAAVRQHRLGQDALFLLHLFQQRV